MMRYLLIIVIALVGFGILAAAYIHFGALGMTILLGLAALIGIPFSIHYSLHQEQLEQSRALSHMSGHARLSHEQFGAVYFPADRAGIAAVCGGSSRSIFRLIFQRSIPTTSSWRIFAWTHSIRCPQSSLFCMSRRSLVSRFHIR